MSKKLFKNQAWYNENGGIFDSFYLEEVKEITSAQRTKKEVDFIEKILRLHQGARILDLACGVGRHSIELARRGNIVVGQDINSKFLKIAKKSAVQNKLAIKFVKADMRRVDFRNFFDSVLLLFNSFGYFSNFNDHQEVLNQVSSALKLGGKFVLDIDNVQRYENNVKKEYKFSLSKRLSVKLISEYDKKNKILNQERIRYRDDKKIQVLRSHIRLFSMPEIRVMLKRAGLNLTEVFADYDEAKPTKESKRIIIVASKV